VRKNIAICADGTGNTTIKGRGTNVFKLYEAVDQSGSHVDPTMTPQVAIYHDGVGTESIRWLAILAGATGWGLTRNVKQLYGELARVYAPGDKIFLFGFSRGAFTVRTLAGLINACGVLDLSNYPSNAAFEKGVDAAYSEYRQKYNSLLTQLFYETKPLDAARVAELRKRFSVRVPEFEDPARYGRLIQFMGVWDTVDAVGLPIAAAEFVNRVIYAFKFPDRTLNLSVARACHALALDEERESFAPVLWNESETEEPERIEQVWFAGVHSNVGGGYPRQGLSLVALDWMMHHAEEQGLRFVPAERLQYRYHADVDDKLYDSRAGLGVFYRWSPRDVQRLCAANAIVPKVQRTVFERIARNTEGYAPGSLPPDAIVVSTTASAEMKEKIRALVHAHHRATGPDVPIARRAAKAQRLGRWGYWLFVYGVTATFALAIWSYVQQALRGTESWQDVALNLADNLVSSIWVGLLLQTLWRWKLLAVWLVVTFWIGMAVDAYLDRRYSEFWHRDDTRLKLRRLLGLG
jgi:uncharacterized protein (DUF2235 family)